MIYFSEHSSLSLLIHSDPLSGVALTSASHHYSQPRVHLLVSAHTFSECDQLTKVPKHRHKIFIKLIVIIQCQLQNSCRVHLPVETQCHVPPGRYTDLS